MCARPSSSAVEHGPGDGGAHPVQGEIGLNQIGDLVVGLVDARRQHLEHVLAGGGTLDLPDGVDRHGGGKITRGRAAHAVGDHEQMRAGVSRSPGCSCGSGRSRNG